jgi:hypothetical protein
MNASKTRSATCKAALRKVDIQKITSEELEALPENVFLASLKPTVRKFVEGLFKLKGIH